MFRDTYMTLELVATYIATCLRLCLCFRCRLLPSFSFQLCKEKDTRAGCHIIPTGHVTITHVWGLFRAGPQWIGTLKARWKLHCSVEPSSVENLYPAQGLQLSAIDPSIYVRSFRVVASRGHTYKGTGKPAACRVPNQHHLGRL